MCHAAGVAVPGKAPTLVRLLVCREAWKGTGVPVDKNP